MRLLRLLASAALRGVAGCCLLFAGSADCFGAEPAAPGVVARPASFPHRTLRLALKNDPRTFDPDYVYAQQDFILLPLLYQPLVDIVDGNRLTNNLVANWDFSADKRVLRFELLPGVRFSNGREATAKDYVFALERAVLAPSFYQQYAQEIKGATNFLAGKVKSLAGVSTTGAYSLVVELGRGDAAFPYWMAQNFGLALAKETLRDTLANVGSSPVGTGPYVVKEWVRGARLRLERNPYYFRPDRQHFDAIEFIIGADDSTQTMMFERGELDVASLSSAGVAPADFRRLRHDPHFTPCWEQAPLYNIVSLTLNVEMPPLNDLRVRRAIVSAIDRSHFERLNGERLMPGHGLITPGMAGFNPELPCPPSDVDQARALLREAGFPNGLPQPLKLWHLNDANGGRWAEALQSDLARAGIKVELQSATAAVMGDTTGRRDGAPLSLMGNNANYPDLATFLDLFHSRFISAEDSQNTSFYQNPAVDDLLGRATVCADEVQRIGLYREAEKLILTDVPVIILGHQRIFALRQPWLKGPLIEPAWWFRLDRVWREK